MNISISQAFGKFTILVMLFPFQEVNFQREGSVLHYGQNIEHSTLESLWHELKQSCDFSPARIEVERFNLHNRWKKRGIAIVPTKFGISFTAKFMNQVIILSVTFFPR